MNIITENAANDTQLSERIELLLKRDIPKRCRRAAVYISRRKTDPWTHEIARNCSVSNVSDALAVIRDDLSKVGLSASCYLPKDKLVNRFGDPSQVHRWHLKIL